jgi:hypothetical protein
MDNILVMDNCDGIVISVMNSVMWGISGDGMECYVMENEMR